MTKVPSLMSRDLPVTKLNFREKEAFSHDEFTRMLSSQFVMDIYCLEVWLFLSPDSK